MPLLDLTKADLAHQLHLNNDRIAQLPFTTKDLMKRFKNILVATDTRHDKHPIVEEAAEIAHFNRASLKIVDVVPFCVEPTNRNVA